MIAQSHTTNTSNFFHFISKVLHDSEFKDAFNQSTESFLAEQGLNSSQIKSICDIHQIIYMEALSDSERTKKLELKWGELIEQHKNEYAEYLACNFSW